jgi:hypothetical protein
MSVEVDPLDESVSKTTVHHQVVLAWYSSLLPKGIATVARVPENAGSMLW